MLRRLLRARRGLCAVSSTEDTKTNDSVTFHHLQTEKNASCNTLFKSLCCFLIACGMPDLATPRRWGLLPTKCVSCSGWI